MAGGTFDYKQYTLQNLIEEMEDLLERLEKEPLEDSWECNSLKTMLKINKYLKILLIKTSSY